MDYPTYSPGTPYHVGENVVFNGTVYYKKHEGDDAAPGTEGSWWVDKDAAIAGADAALAQQVADLEQQLTDAGFSVKYLRAMFCQH